MIPIRPKTARLARCGPDPALVVCTRRSRQRSNPAQLRRSTSPPLIPLDSDSRLLRGRLKSARVWHLADMSIAGCGLFCLASIALMSAVPTAVVAGNSETVMLSVLDGEDIRIAHLSSREGLSQGTVEQIVQDDQGLMWFGTPDGLNRFDGYTFDHYQ